MGCGGGGRGWGPFYRVGEGEVRWHRGGEWSAMVGIQFPTISRSKRRRGVDRRRASAGERRWSGGASAPSECGQATVGGTRRGGVAGWVAAAWVS
jgi:hypothetical protein